MEKIPETYKLDEDDIKDAITEWLNEHHNEYDPSNYEIEFKATQKRMPGKGPAGGMNDDIVITVISAVATKDE